ncbi:hypothetical protein ABZ490_50960 [Streptomyces sp. NPDC005811]|uniref:hypothetical protein n=1 Tax=Streptomyces sp. NPDC005811 TaxID=3154565 RepID=UPI0033E6C7B5
MHTTASTPPPVPPQTAAQQPALTTVDRYYLAWTAYQAEHGHPPTGQQLSVHLTDHGIHGRSGQPVSPATLRRYFLPWRVYTIWAQHRTYDDHPDPDAIAKECATRNITAQYNKPLTSAYITHHTPDFQRRHHTLNHQRTRPHP